MHNRSINEISLNEITSEDLQYLIDEEVIENKILEYKKQVNISNNEHKREFLADVSSFANADGGDIIFGIECDSKTKLPKRLLSASIDDKDNDTQKLEHIIRDGIEPRISSEVYPVDIGENSEDGYALIIRIKKGWDGPYRIKFKDNHRFYTRSSNGKYLMDINELRAGFNLSGTRIEKIKSFILDRISNIYSNEVQYPMEDGAKLAIHLVPVSSFDIDSYYDLSVIAKMEKNFTFPMGSNSANSTYNLDGFVRYSSFQRNKGVHSYIQYFRNGIIESVVGLSGDIGEENVIYPIVIEKYLISKIGNYLRDLEALGVTSPIMIFIVLIDVKNYFVTSSEILTSKIKIHKEIVQLPEIYLENFSQDAKKVLKPCFDVLSNMMGLSKSKSYDEEGDYIGKY